TVLAHDALRRGGKDTRARRQVVDQAAAALLLQGALDAERAGGQPPVEIVTPGHGTDGGAGTGGGGLRGVRTTSGSQASGGQQIRRTPTSPLPPVSTARPPVSTARPAASGGPTPSQPP